MSQDARPLYFRLLRINHLRLRGPVTFALFEGSIGVAVLLALAEIVSWWGVFAIPASVALMVKLNDIVAGSVMRPLAFAHMATARFAGGVITGRSPAPRPSRLTAAIGADDAVADSAARPDSPPTARGRASSIARGVAVVPAQDEPRRRPSPGVLQPEPPLNSAAVDSAEFGAADGSCRLDPTVRRSRGNQGRFTS
jgi:hypothetical protein